MTSPHVALPCIKVTWTTLRACHSHAFSMKSGRAGQRALLKAIPWHWHERCRRTQSFMAFAVRRRTLFRFLILVTLVLFVRLLLLSNTASKVTASFYHSDPQEIQKQGVLDLVTREKTLDARKHKFLQVRMGRDDRDDLFSGIINDGLQDYWNRFQTPLYVHILYPINSSIFRTSIQTHLVVC